VVVVVDLVVVVVVDASLVRRLHRRDRMNYRKLDVYRKAVLFLPIADEIAVTLPPQHGALADQVRRAALSVVLNIAEGSGKTSGPDQRRFYAIARGSAMECGAIVDACMALGLIDPSTARDGDDLLSAVVRMLSRMCRG
jgi:four helix bundle protein